MAVLYADTHSVYKLLPGCDVWDETRDARRWPGDAPVVAHPPCRLWGQMRKLSTAPSEERELALHAVAMVQKWGGVLEHPKGSTLWRAAGLPEIGERDAHGGWTAEVHQHWWGHRAEKATRLYVCGCEPENMPPIKLRFSTPTHVVSNGHGLRKGDAGFRSRVTDRERQATPRAFAEWMVEVARLCIG
ncbi:MAG: hypothetical protein ACREXU_17430, partial [Gammaproteobacteria bacterium]